MQTYANLCKTYAKLMQTYANLCTGSPTVRVSALTGGVRGPAPGTSPDSPRNSPEPYPKPHRLRNDCKCYTNGHSKFYLILPECVDACEDCCPEAPPELARKYFRMLLASKCLHVLYKRTL
jgi:hypothetical protein